MVEPGSRANGASFRGQVALVTGGAHGIGKGIAGAFAAAGANVVVADRNLTGAEEVATDLANRYGVAASAVAVDVRDSASVKAMVRTALEGFSRIDVLINNAGIYPNSPMFELAESEWDDVFDINVKGVFLVAREVAAVMIDQGTKGRIINISSGAAISARPGAAHYCTSKAAVNMLTKVLALELAPHGITVNAISPGLIEVPDWDLNAEYIDTIVSAMPVGRIGYPSDIANGALFLASEASSFITGSIVGIDGGSMAGRLLPLSRKAAPEQEVVSS